MQRAGRERCASIAYTYTEPTVFFEYALDCARLAARAEIKNVFVSNGYLTEEALAIYRDLAALSPARAEVHNNTGTTLLRLGRYAEAGLPVPTPASS